ncbi:MAG: hypothetical protein ABR527_01395 [Gemmatimonadota bacterium]
MSVRIPASLNEWLRKRAGKNRTKADVVRDLIEAEIAREEAARLRMMFDEAANDLTAEDQEDRDLILGAFADQE